jgi:exodeoxyribonuclease VII large subunit
MSSQMATILQNKRAEVLHVENAMKLQDPKLKNKRGFAQISKDEKVISLKNLHVEDTFEVMTDELVIKAKVLEIT